MNRGALRWAQLAGFLLSVNIYLIPTSAASPRATDLGGAVLGLWILGRLLKGKQDARTLAVAVFAILAPGLWCLYSLLETDPATTVQGARWILAAPWALALMPVAADPEARLRFAWGLVAGGFVNILVILLQVAGLEPLLIRLGLSSAGAAFNNYVAFMVRFPGLHGQHNASSAVISLAVPAALYLFLHRRCSPGLLLGIVAGFLLATHLTSTRSPVIVSVVTVGAVAVTSRRPGRIVPGIAVALAVVVPLLLVYGPPGGWARWRNEQAVASNAHERLRSNTGAAEVILEHPLGLGVTAGRTVLGDATGFAAAHNAFLEAGLVFGAGFGLLVLLGILKGALGMAHGAGSAQYLPGMLALHTAGLFMFEEHLNNPTFIILALWFVVLLVRRPVPVSRAEHPLPVD